MFKRFTQEDCSGSTQVKTSQQRAIKQKIVEANSKLEPFIDEILPKKPPLTQVKGGPGIILYCRGEEPLFFEDRDSPIMPTLRFVHQYPDLWTTYTVDKGAIPFIIGGANIMCPGLTNPGASMPVDLDKGSPVIIRAEGKETALAVGFLRMSTKDIREKNKGIGVEVSHFCGDGLWAAKTIA